MVITWVEGLYIKGKGRGEWEVGFVGDRMDRLRRTKEKPWRRSSSKQASKSKRRNSRMWKIKNKKNKTKKKEKYFQGIVIPLSAFVTCSFSPSIRIITQNPKNPKLKWQKQKWLLMGGGDFYCDFWGIWWTPTNETDDDDGDPRFFCSRARRGRKIQRDLVGRGWSREWLDGSSSRYAVWLEKRSGEIGPTSESLQNPKSKKFLSSIPSLPNLRTRSRL